MPVEARFYRSDFHTVNGLMARRLLTTRSNVSGYLEIVLIDFEWAILAFRWGIRVWKRSADGVETEITTGEPIAQVRRSMSGEGLQSGLWSCPRVSLSESDAIVVRVYIGVEYYTGVAWDLLGEWITERLGGVQLDEADWTVIYYTYLRIEYDPMLGCPIWTGRFYFDSPTYDSRIEGFAWSPPLPPAIVRRPIMKMDLGPHLRSRLMFTSTLALKGVGVAPPAPPPPTWEDFMEEWF